MSDHDYHPFLDFGEPETNEIQGLFLGIDPGMNGGIALIDTRARVHTVMAMPRTESDVWTELKTLMNSFSNTVPNLRTNQQSVRGMIEKVHSMPGQGVASAFKFGMGYGGLRMALNALYVPYEDVTPQSWMKTLEIPRKRKTESQSQWKNRLKGIAQQLFPDTEINLKTADALLVAEVCRRRNTLWDT